MADRRDLIRWLKKGLLWSAFTLVLNLVFGFVSKSIFRVNIGFFEALNVKDSLAGAATATLAVIVLAIAIIALGIIINGFIIEKTNEVIKK